jgi:hypothetical protein
MLKKISSRLSTFAVIAALKAAALRYRLLIAIIGARKAETIWTYASAFFFFS